MEINLNNVAVVFTNGSKISETQARKLQRKGIQKAIIMYDSDATKSVKKCGMMLSKYIPKVLICELKGDRDPGDFTYEDFVKVTERMYDPLEFKMGRI